MRFFFMYKEKVMCGVIRHFRGHSGKQIRKLEILFINIS